MKASKTALLGCMILLSACRGEPEPEVQSVQAKVQKIGVLLVNHGSRSETWRNGLLNLESRVRDRLVEDGQVSGVQTAFMEYTEPSIATRLREYDQAGFTDVIFVPIFLTVSPHSFDDIPTIIGVKEDPVSLQALRVEGIERYTPHAKIHMTPRLDFTDILKKNILRRVSKLSRAPNEEGLVLIAYGDQTYEKEWAKLLRDVGTYVRDNTGIDQFAHGWCGHLVHYDPTKTTKAIKKVLKSKATALVVPVLVAHDEMFQDRIIANGVEAVESSKQRVVYRPDAILPDKNIEQWIVDIVAQRVVALQSSESP